MGGGGGGIPKGWLGCPPICESVVAGKFIVFKTPLDKSFDPALGLNNQRFTPGTIFDDMRRKRKRIGLWIDLTNTNRYYHKGLVERQDIQYFKLKCPGHGTVPTEDEIGQFMFTVKSYIESQPLEDDSYIAVHCTHGLNRTGFFICTFLTLYSRFPIRAAIEHFAKCRPPGMYRQMYLDHLLTTHTLMGDSHLPRILVSDPSWIASGNGGSSMSNSNGVVVEVNGNDIEGQGHEPEPGSKNPESQEPEFEFVENPRFFNDNPKIRILEPAEATLILREIQTLSLLTGTKLPFCDWNEVSDNNFNILESQEYFVTTFSASWTRYLLYIKSPRETYFVDLYNTVFLVDAKFTLPYSLNYNEYPACTLLDGYMKWFEGSRQNSYTQFMGFQTDDILAYDGLSVVHLPFSERRSFMEHHIIGPREGAFRSLLWNRRAEFFLLLTMAKYHPVPAISTLLSQVNNANSPREPFKTDGILFKPLRMPYQFAPSINFLKWTKTDTATFQLKILSPNSGVLLIKESLTPFSTIEFSGDLKEGQIIEARFNEHGQWIFCSVKSDQSSPFSLQHARGAMEMQGHVSKEILLEHISKLRTFNSGLLPLPTSIRKAIK